MKLSIIVPVYNLERYIATTIDSLLKINMQYDFEIIVINDGSTDNSEKIIKQYAYADCRVRLITIQNGGVSNARNIGVEMSNGEYIAFVDGDDLVDEMFFSWAINEADKNNYDIIQGEFYNVIDEKIVSRKHNENEILITNFDQMVELFLGDNKIIYNAVWGKLFKKECINDIRFDKNIKIGEDQKFIFDVLKKINRILISNKIAYYYVHRESSAMHRKDIMKNQDQLAVLLYCKKQLKNRKIIENIECHEIRILINIYTTMIRQKVDKEKVDMVYEEISKYKLTNIWKKLSNRGKIKYYLIFNFRFLYDFLLDKRIRT